MNQKAFLSMVLFNVFVGFVLYSALDDLVLAIIAFLGLSFVDAFALKFVFNKPSNPSDETVEEKEEKDESRH